MHLWGRASAVDELDDIARRHGLTLMYDAAHALLCSHRGRMIGGFGEAEVFSFHATKFVNSFEGGAIATDDDELAHRARLMRNFGFTDYDEVQALGTNGKMSEVSAAMGLTSLESADEFIAVNRRNYLAYRRGLAAVPGIDLLRTPRRSRTTTSTSSWKSTANVPGLSRDQLQRLLWAENVVARRYFYPGCHRMEPYRSMPRYRGVSCPRRTPSPRACCACRPEQPSAWKPSKRFATCSRLAVRHGPRSRAGCGTCRSATMPIPTNRFRRMRRRTLGRWNKQARAASELHRLLDVTIPVLAASNAFYCRILALMSACSGPPSDQRLGLTTRTDDSDWRL